MGCHPSHWLIFFRGVGIPPTREAFTLRCGGDKIVTWGEGKELTALRDGSDGSVKTWGSPHFGGDISTALLADGSVVKHGAFAAILRDRSVVTWGKPNCGGDSSAVQVQHVEQIHAADRAFAAIADSSVVAWGHELYGGDWTSYAFAAVLADGSVVTWGNPTKLWWQLSSPSSEMCCRSRAPKKSALVPSQPSCAGGQRVQEEVVTYVTWGWYVGTFPLDLENRCVCVCVCVCTQPDQNASGWSMIAPAQRGFLVSLPSGNPVDGSHTLPFQIRQSIFLRLDVAWCSFLAANLILVVKLNQAALFPRGQPPILQETSS